MTNLREAWEREGQRFAPSTPDIPTAYESARERFEAAVEAHARAQVLRAELDALGDTTAEYEAALRALGAAIAAEVRRA